jgi:sporulation protein YlmC with PRC-barrel domain
MRPADWYFDGQFRKRRSKNNQGGKETMKLKLVSITTATVAFVLSLTSFGADSPAVQDGGRSLRGDEATRVDSRRLDHASNLAKASDVIGMEVKNAQGEKLGKVENLLVDLETGRVAEVIVSSGGFLGMGDELSAVSPRAFRYDPGQKLLALDMSKEALAQAPHFKRKDLSTYTGTGSAGVIERGTGSDRGSSSDRDGSDADNTKRNVRDRSGTVTPFDQGSNKRDLEITQEIRSEINKQKDLSVNAHNAKVMTTDGRVTLRGPVNSDDEKRVLGEIASRAAQADHVDNQLEVKRPGNE